VKLPASFVQRLLHRVKPIQYLLQRAMKFDTIPEPCGSVLPELTSYKTTGLFRVAIDRQDLFVILSNPCYR